MCKRIIPVLILVVFTISCKQKGYQPSEYLTLKQQDAIMWTLMRYVARPPEGLTFPERFYKGYDKHYQEQQALHKLDAFYIKGDTCFFMVSRRAPSLVEKRVANAGKFVLTEKGELMYYKEVFRTFKMKSDELHKKSFFLFDRMVKNEDL
ncbi:MAG: hypothetical protein ACKO96_48085, partial [Flammeovirgaceae bacterium]